MSASGELYSEEEGLLKSPEAIDHPRFVSLVAKVEYLFSNQQNFEIHQ